MNLTIGNNTMSSREIAELTGKDHSNVKRDISGMILQLNYPERLLKDCPVFNPSELKGHGIELLSFEHTGNTYDEFVLNQEYSILLVSGYKVALRHNIIKRWQELESAVQTPAALPGNYIEALQALIESEKEKSAAQEQLQLAAPKIAFVDKYVESTGNKGFREVAKLLKIKEPAFRIFLSDNFIMYQLAGSWTAYQKHVDAGRFFVSTGTKNKHAYNEAKFTPKGVAWIGQLVGEK